MRVNTADIEEPPQIVKNVGSDNLNGVVKLDNGNRLIMLLDIVKALSVNSTGKINEQDESLHRNGTMQSSIDAEVIEEEQLVTFLLDKEEYAIGIMKVKEITHAQFVKVPN